MKKRLKHLLILLACIFVLFAACNDGDNTPSLGYSISFDLNGVTTHFSNGNLTTSVVALGNRLDSSSYEYLLVAKPYNDYIMDSYSNYVCILFKTVTNVDGSFSHATNFQLGFMLGNTNFTKASFNLTITSIGEVGEPIIGTFNAVTYFGSITNILTNGTIRVLRLPDNTQT